MRNFINKNKNLLKGLFAVLLTIAFAGAVRYLAVEDNNVKNKRWWRIRLVALANCGY